MPSLASSLFLGVDVGVALAVEGFSFSLSFSLSFSFSFSLSFSFSFSLSFSFSFSLSFSFSFSFSLSLSLGNLGRPRLPRSAVVSPAVLPADFCVSFGRALSTSPARYAESFVLPLALLLPALALLGIKSGSRKRSETSGKAVARFVEMRIFSDAFLAACRCGTTSKSAGNVGALFLPIVEALLPLDLVADVDVAELASVAAIKLAPGTNSFIAALVRIVCWFCESLTLLSAAACSASSRSARSGTDDVELSESE